MPRVELVVQQLRAYNLHLAVAESLTAGLVAATIADVPGASHVLQGGIVAYQTPLKHRLLGVEEDLLAAYGAVYPGVAEQMAAGVRQRLAEGALVSTIGISTTGVAGPDWQDDHPPGLVYVGLATESGTRAFEHHFGGSRQEIREAAVAAVVDHLWEYLGADLR